MQTPHNSCYLVFEKMSKTHFGKKKDSTVNKQYWETWISTRSTMKPDPIFHRNVTLNSKWIKALKTRPDTMKVHEVRAAIMCQLTGICKDFLSKTPVHRK